MALGALWDARRLLTSLITSCLTTDAVMGSDAPLHKAIHPLRGQPGQIEAAALMRGLMAGSGIRDSHRKGDARVQDPCCIRCQPQVTGAALDLLRFAARTLEVEVNAVTNNPLVLEDSGVVLFRPRAEPEAAEVAAGAEDVIDASAPLPRNPSTASGAPAPDILAGIQATAMRHAGHGALWQVGLSASDWLLLHQANIEDESG